jgi:catechol 2,3-dioxygenase-like lactoylglutathione lyase family enzyme
MTEPLLGWPSWVGVVAENLEAQRRFYRDVMGLREVDSSADWVGFDMGEGRVFELLRRDPQVPEYAERRYQVGFEVSNIRAARDELVGRDVEVVGEVQGGEEAGALWAYFRDPEGNVFEITQRLRDGSGPD